MEIISNNFEKYDTSWWNNLYKNHNHTPSPYEDAHHKYVAEMVSGKSVIEIGCGQGWFSQFVDNYIGYDWSEQAIKKAKENFGQKDFRVGDFDSASKSKRKYDYACCFEIFEHLTQPKEEIEKIRKIVDKVIVVLPYGRFGKDVVENDKELLKNFTEDLDYHYATYTEEDILEMWPHAEITKLDQYHFLFII